MNIKSAEKLYCFVLLDRKYYLAETAKQLYDSDIFEYSDFNPIQDGGREGGAKRPPPTSFSPVTSANVGFGSQNFLTFSFKPFTTLVQNIKFAPSASRKLLNLNQDHPSKKAIFLVKSL